MDTKKNESPLLFANEDGIFRIISIAKIISWIILAIYLVIFVDNLIPLFQKQATLPTQFSQWPPFLANLLYIPTLGTLYFLVLQGLAQGLNLGLDIFYELHPEEEDDDEEESVVVVEENVEEE
jgi:hypothetical protein